MEQFNKMKFINYSLIAVFLAVMICAFFAQENAYVAKMYTGRAKENFTIVLLSKPAMILDYDPSGKRVTVTQAEMPAPKKTKNPPPALTYKEQAKKLLELKGIKTSHVKFIAAPGARSETMWTAFKQMLSNWRYNPLSLGLYCWNYITSYAKGRTNINPAEFTLLTLMTLDMEITDFSITVSKPQKNTKQNTLAMTDEGGNSPLTAEDRPLIVEIYNGSGRKGAALELTQYLRDLNEKGFIKVDVLQYDSTSPHEETKIVDNSGRQKELKQLSLLLGLRENELFSEKSPSDFCDAKIIIGKNFKMPK